MTLLIQGTAFAEDEDGNIREVFEKDWDTMDYPADLVDKAFMEGFTELVMKDKGLRKEISLLAFDKGLLDLPTKVKAKRNEEIQRSKKT